MTDREHRQPGDTELEQALRQHLRTTSARHDEAVLEAARSTAAARRRERRRARSSRMRIGAALAATVMLGVGLLWLVPVEEGPKHGALRGERAAVLPLNGATLAAPPGELEWPAQRDAAGYRVALLDAGARLLWQSEPVAENRLVLPQDVARRLANGGTYLWMVEIQGDGRAREIGPFSFDVAAER